MARCRTIEVLAALFLLFALASGTSWAAPAASIGVNTLVDENDGNCGDGDCSLRDAIQLAGPDDTIKFTVAGAIALRGGLGPLMISKHVVIAGPGWDKLRIGVNQAGMRAIKVTSTGNLEISSVTMDGRGIGGGIEIDTSGALKATGVVFGSNKSSGNGGAVLNRGTLLLVGCSFDSNSAAGHGGGIHNLGTAIVQRTTFWRNTATYGAGLKNAANATVVNSTFYLNQATTRGAGLDADGHGTVNVLNSTIFDNKGGSGLGNPLSTTTVVNTVVAANAGGNCSGGAFTSASNNISSDATCSPGFNQVASSALKLAWEGFAVSIGSGSPAIDAGTNASCPPTDQVLVPRPQDGNRDGSAICDVGSYERLPPMLYVPLLMRAG